MTAKWQELWPEFEEVMKSRLQAGHLNYGDGSFDRPPNELLEELAQEALDIVGWGFILWARIRKAQQLAESVK